MLYCNVHRQASKRAGSSFSSYTKNETIIRNGAGQNANFGLTYPMLWLSQKVACMYYNHQLSSVLWQYICSQHMAIIHVAVHTAIRSTAHKIQVMCTYAISTHILTSTSPSSHSITLGEQAGSIGSLSWMAIQTHISFSSSV
jgi:hypothetical protein